MLSSLIEYVDKWDSQLQWVLFGYRNGMWAHTKFSPFMILIRQMYKLKVDNYLGLLTHVINDEIGMEKMAKHVIAKMELIVGMHFNILKYVEKVQHNQKKMYAFKKGKYMFPSFATRKDMVKMKKPGKKKALKANWERPYLFIRYVDEKELIESHEGGRICIIKGCDEDQ